MPEIRRIAATDRGLSALLEHADAYFGALYPAASNHLESAAALGAPNVAVFGGYTRGRLVACGAVKLASDDGCYAEVKRVFVLPEARGRGFATAIMTAIERHAAAAGAAALRLETGVAQPEALALYRKLGFRARPPFGAYRADPLSVFFEKPLIGAERGAGGADAPGA